MGWRQRRKAGQQVDARDRATGRQDARVSGSEFLPGVVEEQGLDTKPVANKIQLETVPHADL